MPSLRLHCNHTDRPYGRNRKTVIPTSHLIFHTVACWATCTRPIWLKDKKEEKRRNKRGAGDGQKPEQIKESFHAVKVRKEETDKAKPGQKMWKVCGSLANYYRNLRSQKLIQLNSGLAFIKRLHNFLPSSRVVFMTEFCHKKKKLKLIPLKKRIHSFN